MARIAGDGKGDIQASSGSLAAGLHTSPLRSDELSALYGPSIIIPRRWLGLVFLQVAMWIGSTFGLSSQAATFVIRELFASSDLQELPWSAFCSFFTTTRGTRPLQFLVAEGHQLSSTFTHSS